MKKDMDKKEELRVEVLRFCHVDWAGLWVLASLAEEILGIEDEVGLRRESLAMVRELLTAGLVQVGDVDWERGVFEPWPLSAAECVSRIEREWSALGSVPSLSEICWLSATREGHAAADGLVAGGDLTGSPGSYQPER